MTGSHSDSNPQPSNSSLDSNASCGDTGGTRATQSGYAHSGLGVHSNFVQPGEYLVSGYTHTVRRTMQTDPVPPEGPCLNLGHSSGSALEEREPIGAEPSLPCGSTSAQTHGQVDGRRPVSSFLAASGECSMSPPSLGSSRGDQLGGTQTVWPSHDFTVRTESESQRLDYQHRAMLPFSDGAETSHSLLLSHGGPRRNYSAPSPIWLAASLGEQTESSGGQGAEFVAPYTPYIAHAARLPTSLWGSQSVGGYTRQHNSYSLVSQGRECLPSTPGEQSDAPSQVIGSFAHNYPPPATSIQYSDGLLSPNAVTQLGHNAALSVGAFAEYERSINNEAVHCDMPRNQNNEAVNTGRTSTSMARGTIGGQHLESAPGTGCSQHQSLGGMNGLVEADLYGRHQQDCENLPFSQGHESAHKQVIPSHRDMFKTRHFASPGANAYANGSRRQGSMRPAVGGNMLQRITKPTVSKRSSIASQQMIHPDTVGPGAGERSSLASEAIHPIVAHQRICAQRNPGHDDPPSQSGQYDRHPVQFIALECAVLDVKEFHYKFPAHLRSEQILWLSEDIAKEWAWAENAEAAQSLCAINARVQPLQWADLLQEISPGQHQPRNKLTGQPTLKGWDRFVESAKKPKTPKGHGGRWLVVPKCESMQSGLQDLRVLGILIGSWVHQI